ncbi:maleylpyruvate isomerase N-terminal domain-containing protein [Kocuria turfanensis]|uniref:Maleylpyruvate isomerase n=1 Tax=Kocuria turfanensis TaxID=388357 RepID=A0A512I9Z6_9MICC|nr:maleylpyruvate isomerase N-terminal domain-containing protein [Kocuria turfanensis]GEO94525.1 maleylpyruvate isomerase [Kocuria turfanensis]
MTSRNTSTRADLVRDACTAFAAVLDGLGDDDSWAPTGCRGWSVRDLAHHCAADAVRGLVALHTPTTARPDRDAATYWADRGADPAAAAEDRRRTRAAASLYPDWEELRGHYRESARALVHAAERCRPGGTVRTQGHVLRVDDLLSTLAVEATVHHLDLIEHLEGCPGPAVDGLAEVRRVLTDLWEREPPEHWSDEHFARVGTGRAALPAQDRVQLGPEADLLPLFS